MLINIEIDGKRFACESGKTILDVAKDNKIEIPTLCFLKGVMEESNCRICVVENSKTHKLVTACSTQITEGLSVLTNSEKVVESRKNTLKLFLSNHHKDCENCIKDGHCKLQDLFDEYGVNETEEDFFQKKNYDLDLTSPCIVRDNNKCILCGRCVNICSNTQAVNALTKQQRGFNAFVGCAFDKNLKDSTCVGCGQCTLVCPTGALYEHNEVNKFKEIVADKDCLVYAQVAPSVRVSLAEAFGNELGTFDEDRMVEALKLLGVDKVFDINLGADFTVVEEANELLERIKTGKDLPQFSSCCPAWFKYVYEFYPEYTNCISGCKSPTEMLGAIIKNFYAEKENIPKEKIKVVGIMPCTAKKGERNRGKDVDVVLTTRELADLIKEKEIDYNKLKGKPFDRPLSDYTGGGLIFGATGGVTEAVLRFVCNKLNVNKDKIVFDEVRHGNGRKEAVIKCGDVSLNLCVVSGLRNAKLVMDDIISGKAHYHFIEVMACPGGCVNGGGQNYVDYDTIDVDKVKYARAESLYKKDDKMKNRESWSNKTVQEIYSAFFIPSPEKAKKLLHWRHEN